MTNPNLEEIALESKVEQSIRDKVKEEQEAALSKDRAMIALILSACLIGGFVATFSALILGLAVRIFCAVSGLR